MDPAVVVDQLVETWRINNRINQYLLDEVGEDRLTVALSKGKSVDAQFAHIHNVRLMWLKVAAPELHDPLTKLEKDTVGLSALREHLGASGEAIAQLVRRSAETGGKVKNFKPNVTAFVGYLIAHESNHRGQIELALRQAGQPISDKAGYGLWEWGTR